MQVVSINSVKVQDFNGSPDENPTARDYAYGLAIQAANKYSSKAAREAGIRKAWDLQSGKVSFVIIAQQMITIHEV